MLRKTLPYLLFAALGLLTLAGAQLFPQAVAWLYDATTAKQPPLELSKATYALAALGDSSATQAVRTAEAINAVRANATGAEIAAGQQASGWVPSATVASKFIAFAGAYLLAVLLPWGVQHLTHPLPTRWAKERYSLLFKQLSDEEQFAVYGRLQLVIVIRAAAALVFAALVV